MIQWLYENFLFIDVRDYKQLLQYYHSINFRKDISSIIQYAALNNRLRKL